MEDGEETSLTEEVVYPGVEGHSYTEGNPGPVSDRSHPVETTELDSETSGVTGPTFVRCRSFGQHPSKPDVGNRPPKYIKIYRVEKSRIEKFCF